MPSDIRYSPLLQKPTSRLPVVLRPLLRLIVTFLKLYYRHRILLTVLTFLPPLLFLPILHISSRSKTLVPSPFHVTRRPLLVVAHPDDECLFFSPAVLGAARTPLHDVDPAVLVLSNGNNYGIGDVRVGELRGSCEELGVREELCTVMNVPELQDNPKEWWPAEKIAEIVKKHAEEIGADLIITFDSGGISGHINHKSVFLGLQHLVRTHPTTTPPTYASTTVSLPRKYSSLLDLTFTALPFLPRLLLTGSENTDRALFVADWSMYKAARRAFGRHASQLSWDRYFYMVLSRYMMMNDLERVR
ncbi:putative glycan biosynthesis protein [Powellomyces hirtus]|nr:putative glycan biosynthesis protein [Powellomyces hirtus]